MKYDRRALKRLMVERGIAVEKLSDDTGLTRQAIYDIVRGTAEPKADTLGALAQALSVPLEKFYRVA